MHKGFTIIELLISILISSIIMGLVYTLFISLQKNHMEIVKISDMYQNTRSAMDAITRDLKITGADPQLKIFSNTNPPIKTAGTDEIHIEMDITDLDDSGNPDGIISGTKESVIYSLYDSGNDEDSDLGRKREGGNNIAVSENIELLRFYYFDKDLNLLDDSTGKITTPDNIRAIQVVVLGRVEREDRSYKNNKIYEVTLASGNKTTVFKATGDGYKRYLLSSIVHLQNLNY
ncbi:MAG: prepilin-type N-terminal cleavage/methylation domain-containing protein [Deltaproteobacteria bacterium]|nr:prepilin-type N-terminal cleavage/methylation domain-containing protein [Deltaproteobacteria bacterium]